MNTDALYDFSIDRSTGAGRGWLFKFDATGKLLGKVELSDGTMFHPGGMDYDGRYLWVPVAEYRPNSQTRIYRVNPRTLAAELVFTAKDHIGGLVHNVHGGTLHGVSWGSRRLYTWTLSRDERHVKGSLTSWEPNSETYSDAGSGPNAGLVVTNNAFWLEPKGDGTSLRAWFMTETNNQAKLLTYDITPWVNQ